MKILWQSSSLVSCRRQQVHLWLVALNPFTDQVLDFFALLDEPEKQRANQFKFKKDHQCFVISHGALRIILSQYLSCLSKEIQFQNGKNKKPFLPQYPDWHFNLSHSGDYALIAVTQDTPVGVDIEQLKPIEHKDKIAERFFSKSETLEYQQLSADQKLLGFYNAWTRKEAFVKAIGQGIFYALNQFDVTLTPDQPIEILSINGDVNEAKQWQLQGFIPVENYCAAVAWQGKAKSCRYFNFVDKKD